MSLLLPPPLVAALVMLVAFWPARALPTADNVLDDHSLLSKLQTCFTASGMGELDAPGEQLAQNMPSVSQRGEILQTFLDCCAKQDFPGLEALETGKQQKASSVAELSAQLKRLQQKIQAIYKKYLMGSSVGLNMHSLA